MGLRLLPITVAVVVWAPLAARLPHRVPSSVALPTSLALVISGLALLGGFNCQAAAASPAYTYRETCD